MSDIKLHELYPEIGRELLTASGTELIKKVGNDGMRDLLLNVLNGGNVRDVTEFISKERLMKSNASLLELIMLNLSESTEDEQYFNMISEGLQKVQKKDKIIYLWLMGLNQKALDNVVRGADNIDKYKEQLIETSKEQTKEIEHHFGELSGLIKYKDQEIDLNWGILNKLFMAIGAQTLTIRGSEKSSNGKLFGSLILTTVLELFGFKLLEGPPAADDANSKVFWLEFTDKNKREADAVLLFENKGVAFDIGFIGRGNPEITLDKVTRFDSMQRYANKDYEMKTIIIVDTISENSIAGELSKHLGKIIPMNDDMWVIKLARVISEFTDYRDPILDTNPKDLESYLEGKLELIDFEDEVNKFRKVK